MKLIDNINSTLKDDLVSEIKSGSKLSVAAACFSIYAYQELKEKLNIIDELRFIFTSPTFTAEKMQKEKREFYIPRLHRERSLYPPLGKYGMLRKTYLKENFKIQYSLMLMNDTLWPHLLQIDEQAHDMMDTIVERMKQERCVTEQLKADDWWC